MSPWDIVGLIVGAWLVVSDLVMPPPKTQPPIVQEVHAAETDAMVPGP